MFDKHWTDDELVARLFGVGPEGGHLEKCAECARRFEIIRRRDEDLRMTMADTAVTEDRLAAQRFAIHARLQDGSRRIRLSLTPSLAAVSVIVLAALIVFKPASPKLPAPDPAWKDIEMEEIFRMSLSTEPDAIAPVQSLFEERQ